MKNYVPLILAFVFFYSISNAQNLVKNPSFEDGSVVTGPTQVDHADYWYQGCGHVYNGWADEYWLANSADLFDYYSTDCFYETPDNKWASNLWPAQGRRYVAFNGNMHYSDMQHPDYAYGESVKGDLWRRVADDCYYRIRFSAAVKREITYNCDDYNNRIPHPNLRVQAVLRKSDDCEIEKVVYTSPILTSANWVTLYGGFFLDSDEYDIGFDQIEFRVPLLDYQLGYVKAVFIDNIDLRKYQVGVLDPSFDLSLQTNSSHYTVTATAPPLPDVVNLGYYWSVSELDEFGNDIASNSMYNPSIWWTGGTYNTFPQYCCYDPSISPYGQFEYGKTYRITRGLWAQCYSWNSESYIVSISRNSAGEEQMMVERLDEEAEAKVLGKLEAQGILKEAENAIQTEQLMASNTATVPDAKVFPNPTNGELNIQLNEVLAKEAQSVQIVNIYGQTVRSIDLIEANIKTDLSHLAKGIYFVQINTGSQIISKKVLLQ